MKRGLPLDRGIESTFPARAAAPSLPDRLRVVTFNVHGEPGDVIATPEDHTGVAFPCAHFRLEVA